MDAFTNSDVERFFQKLKGQITPHGECWLWAAARNEGGYGRFWSKRKVWLAHRWAYEWLVGPIPDGYTLDHLCRNPACCNPVHLEPVTNRENILRGEGFPAKQARQTRCLRGHALSGTNLYVYRPRHGGEIRQCRACRRQHLREFRERQRDVVA